MSKIKEFTRRRTACIFIAAGSLFFFSSAFSFQPGYQSVDSTPPPEEPNEYDIRFIMNAPYSYCQADGIPENMCGKVGLRLDGIQFRNLNATGNFDRDYGFQSNNAARVGESNLARVVSFYKLPPYIYTKGSGLAAAFNIPTEGQLVWMFNNNLVPKGGSGAQYWIKKGSKYQVIGIGAGIAPTQKIASLYRLVTEDVPSACGTGSCKEFLNKKGFTIKFRNNACGLSWGWRVEWSVNGRTDGYSGRWEGQYTVPNNYDWVSVAMWSGVSGYKYRRNIQNTDRDTYTSTECYALTGNCVVHSVSNVACW